MSKWSLVESKKRNLLVSLPLLFLLAFSFITIFVSSIPKAQALSPQFTFITEQISNVGAVATLTTTFNPNNACVNSGACTGLTFVITLQSIPYVTISSITDNAALTPDVYHQVVTDASQFNVAGDSIWYTVVNTVNSGVTAVVFTINFNTACTSCEIDFLVSNQPVTPTSMISGTPIAVVNSAINPANIPLLNTLITASSIQFSGTQQYLVLNDIMVNGTFSGYITYADSPPLVQTRYQAIQSLAGWELSQTNITPNGGTISYQFQVTAAASVAGHNHNCGAFQYCTGYFGAMITAVFSTTTITPPNCQNCGISGGGTTKDTTTTFSITLPNETLLYTFDAPVGGAFIQNITTEVASYTNAGVGKNLDYIYLCIYNLPSGVLSSKTSISSGNPMNQNICTLIHTISTGQTNQYIHWYPNILIPPSTTFAISIMSRFSGLSLYGSSSNVQLYGDTADYVAGSGTPPIKIANIFLTFPPIFFGFTGSQTPIFYTQTATTTVTVCTVGGTCTFTTATVTIAVTQVFTSFLYSLQGSNGAVANIQDITAFLPIWVLPLVMGALFGVIGLLFGGVLGLGMGVMLGIVPLWFAFLLGLGIVFILFKRVI